MKALLTFLFLIAIFGCGNSTQQNVTADSSATYGLLNKSAVVTKTPYVHWELLSDKGEAWDVVVANYHKVIVLSPNYKTDGTGAACIACLRHSADVANGIVDTDYVSFPWVVYRMLADNREGIRFNTWVYLSKKNIPDRTKEVIAWMDSLAPTVGLPGRFHDSTANIACLDKWRWDSRSK